jgi:hypothetical protein
MYCGRAYCTVGIGEDAAKRWQRVTVGFLQRERRHHAHARIRIMECLIEDLVTFRVVEPTPAKG